MKRARLRAPHQGAEIVNGRAVDGAQLAAYVVKITKMWRKFGAWFWIATQNLEDFPDQAKKMLNMIEWWLCLNLPKKEVNQIAPFKDLNEDQKHLLLSARKEPGKYVEGVLIAPRLETLFRSVPPALSLALAMTERKEKAERHQIMRKRGCTELAAARVVADEDRAAAMAIERIQHNRSLIERRYARCAQGLMRAVQYRLSRTGRRFEADARLVEGKVELLFDTPKGQKGFR